MPTSVQAGFYSATLRYLERGQGGRHRRRRQGDGAAEGRPSGTTRSSARATIRADGRKMHDMYLFEVKKPAESKGPWDYYKLLAHDPRRRGLPPDGPGRMPAGRRRTELESQPWLTQSNIYAGVAGYFGKPDHPGKVGVFRRAAEGGDWKHVLGGVEAYTVFVHPDDPETVFAGTNDGVWRSTDRGATFRRADFPDQEAGLVASWSTAAIPKKMLAGASPIDVYRSEDGGESWRKLATPKIGDALQGAVRLARDALRAEPEEAGRDLRRARDQRRDAQHRRRRDLDGLQRRPDQARRAAASQEQDRERHHGRGHARRPCRDHQSGRSRLADRGAAHGPVPHHRPRQDAGRTWRSSRFSPTTYGRDIKVSTGRAEHALRRALGRRLEPRRRRSIAARTTARAGSASTRSRCTAPSCRSACTTAIPNQVYLGARYDGEMFGTQDGGKTWQAMPLPGEVQHIYSVACG